MLQTIVLWAAVVYACMALVISVMVPILDPEGARKPMPRTGWWWFFRVLIWLVVGYACLYAVGVVS